MKRLLLVCGLVANLVYIPALPGMSAEPVDYSRDIRPLLENRCVACHGPDDQQSGLRLDAAALIRQGGDRGPAVVSGKSSESLLIRVLAAGSDIPRMPKDDEPLAPAEIELLKTWIDSGAAAPADEVIAPPRNRPADHWAFRPIQRLVPPDVRQTGWVRSPIDRFILAKLESLGMSPSPEADRATLIRRLSLDLRGVPPEPAEVDAFVNDPAPDAYERLVDRLLASPQYGERWGRHWLDAARYADSNGYTIDGPRNIWKYRDWVIEALNRDMPFDEFTILQLAGDILPGAGPEQVVATGFHRNTLINQEGGTDKEQFRVEAVVDRVATTGSVFLGLTLGCARCHEHKYDPISQREFYELFALFNNCDEPEIALPTPEQAQRLQAARERLKAAEERLRAFDAKAEERRAAYERKLAALPLNVHWTVLDPSEFSSAGGATLTELDDRSLLVGGAIPAQDTYTVTLELPIRGPTAIRVEALTHESLPRRGPGLAANGNFVLTHVAVTRRTLAEPDTAHPVKIVAATAEHSQPRFPVEHAIDNDPQKTGWAINVPQGSLNVDRAAVFIFDKPLGENDIRMTITLAHGHPNRYSIGRFRLWMTTAPAEVLTLPDDLRAALALAPEKRTPEQQQTLAVELLREEPERMPLQMAVNEARRQVEAVQQQIPVSMVVRERTEPRPTHIHIRGDFLRPGAKVSPGVPAALPPLQSSDRPPNRLDFARWLVDPHHPLTPRVTVNRIWQHYFGRGIVETENDFGTQGDAPSHPELLDWLASELVQQGWSLKALHRQIITSAAYRQSSAATAGQLAADRYNRWWGRQPRLRLEAEVIRDSALAASGLLVRKIGGPGVFPPQPEGIYRFTQNQKNWKASQGEDRYRRGLYTYFWRSSPDPFLMTFDAPSANVTCTRRVRSNTPLQSLTLANDLAMMELAQGLAARVLREVPAGDVPPRVELMFRLCLSRRPSDNERAVLANFAWRQLEAFRGAPQDAKRLAPAELPPPADVVEAAAWTAVARVLLNLDEFITRE
jgi:hypothetical protein